MQKKKRRYGKYPEQKTEDHGLLVPAKYHRINPRIRYLKPIKRTTRAKGKEYTHYVIATTVPEEWKDGVKVTIEPVKGSVELLRQSERNLNEMGPEFREKVDGYLEEETREADRVEKLFDQWEDNK